MAQRRKLQVFVSSTFTDLKEERQAAVEAILKAGHIPAGMELFAATDKSQMDVIKRWIDESDAYLLLLGGRYGSIEPESGKSYTELEYDYAVQKGKAFFSVVITESHLNEKVTKIGKEVLELDNPQLYKRFHTIATSKMVEFWSDIRDIKYAIQTTLIEFSNRPELIGWVPGSESVDSSTIAELAEEVVRLGKENADLRDQLKSSSSTALYSGLTFNQMYFLLNKEFDTINLFTPDTLSIYQEVARIFNDSSPSLLHVFFIWGKNYTDGRSMSSDYPPGQLAYTKLSELGLLQRENRPGHVVDRFTLDGSTFYIRLQLERDTKQARAVAEELNRLFELKRLEAND